MTENSHICRLLDANTITDDNGERHLADGWESLFDMMGIGVKHDSNNPDICIFKYKPQADFNEPIVREARGIIIDVKKCEVLCWPFDKFGNWFEPYAAKIDLSTAMAQEKIDGSLVKLWWHDGEWHWSTMNTIDARDAKVPYTGKTFYDLIQDALAKTKFNLDNFIGSGSTHMFELVSPYTQVVVRHEETKLYYLGSRDISSGEESIYRQLKRVFDMPESYPVSDMAEIIEKAEQLDGHEHEGFVVVDANFNRVKVKSPEYVRIHHTMNNGFLRKEDAVRIIREFDTEAIEAIKSRDELRKAMRFYALETHWAGIKLVGLVTEARAFFAERYNYDRKAFATEYAAQFQPPWKAMAFMAIDTDIDPLWFPDALDIKTLCKLVPDYQA